MKAYLNIALGVFLLAVLPTITAPVSAKDCGEQPVEAPTIPSGAGLSVETIRTARDEVLAYSEKVDAYIACMDETSLKVAAYMTKEQKSRRQDDLADLHNVRRDLQLALNEAIRAFRRTREGQ